MHTIFVKSSIDGSIEPNLLWTPESTESVPLLVGLHTWSYDRYNQVESMLPHCKSRNWALLLPEARGPNLASNPRVRQAAGARTARQDVLDAISATLISQCVDASRIYLLGGSGGGHLALLVAADAPRLFAAVSSWVPATDLTTFYLEKPNPCSHIEAFCGGPPGKSSAVDLEYRERSPLFRAADLALVNLSIHHGRHDKLVHWTHTFRMAKEIAAYHPERLYFEIFDGGHEIGYDRAFAWFERQRNEI